MICILLYSTMTDLIIDDFPTSDLLPHIQRRPLNAVCQS